MMIPKSSTVRKYGKQTRRLQVEQAFVELPKTPAKTLKERAVSEDPISKLTQKLTLISLEENFAEAVKDATVTSAAVQALVEDLADVGLDDEDDRSLTAQPEAPPTDESEGLRIITWADVCPPGDRIEKIAEASYAEVYRVSNERGTSIIKVIRLESPIKAQTKAQENSGLVDELPHCEDDLRGELQISEWLADIPGFVIYKERYLVRGKAPKALLETHQTFHRRMKRKDPDRLQFYPSPGRYLDDTKFLVIELGDAGVALEDFALITVSQIWDVFFHVAVALARAEEKIQFEVRT
jgi:serine/threonine-protein kinase haspin